MGNDVLIIGLSGNVFAEYSYRADAPYTYLEMCEGEVTWLKGYDSKAELLADAADAESLGVPVYRFFIEQ